MRATSCTHYAAGMHPVAMRLMGAALKLHQWIYETTDGRLGAAIAGRPMLLLRTVGRRTGQPRTAALLYIEDGANRVVVASKGGAPENPGWFHNLRANPDVEIQVGRDRMPVRARVAQGDERDRLWKAADKVNAGTYETYQSLTSRQIPVIVLEPR